MEAPLSAPGYLNRATLETNQEEFLAWLKPRAATEEEREAMGRIDAADLEIYSEKLNLILDEAMKVFVRTGMGGMLLSGDCAVAIYTAEGELVAANCGTYLHVLSGMIPIKFILMEYGGDASVGIREGDVFYGNDARFGGIHNPDQFAIMPIFYEGELLAWATSGLHTAETGATLPGGMPIAAKSRHDEGMKLVPIKIGENYTLRRDLVDMIVNYMSRAPILQRTDMNARITACDRVRRRVVELAGERGAGFLRGLFRKLLVVSEVGARERIRRWRDGVYRAVSFSDSVGHKEALQRISLALHKRGENILLDFSGTSPETDGPFHVFPVGAAAHTAIYLFGFPFYDLPKSIGTYAPIQFRFPSGSLLYPCEEAAVSNCVFLCSGLMAVVNDCFARLMYASGETHLVTANMGYDGCGYGFAAQDRFGVKVADMLAAPINTMGSGARPDQDGVDAFGFPYCPFGRAQDTEQVEKDNPLLHLCQRFWEDSSGPGKHRGGSGIVMVLTPFMTENLKFLWMSKSTNLVVTHGLFGGYACSVIPAVQVVGTDFWEKFRGGDPHIPTRLRELLVGGSLAGTVQLEHRSKPPATFQPGDLVVVFSIAGGGYGDVLERDPEKVLEDLRAGIISSWTARSVYRVWWEEGTGRVDRRETRTGREQERADRLRRALPFETFMEQWGQKRPKEEILEYFGSWPEGRPLRSVVRP